jgi:hypothetical protein
MPNEKSDLSRLMHNKIMRHETPLFSWDYLLSPLSFNSSSARQLGQDG